MRLAARTATTLVAIVTIVASGTAHASWTVKGHGFGHGVGLSQYGAFGFAENGRGYKKILRHYYSRTKIGKADRERIRVLLESRRGSVSFRGAGRACGERINAKRKYSFAPSGGGVELRAPDGHPITACGIEGTAGHGVKIGAAGRYRGDLIARNRRGSLLVINRVGVESYVMGVVANEVPSSWPAQALRAQAVVARSYGLATDRGGPFDQYSDTRSQVYGGRSSETRATNAAVNATSAEVVKHGGEIATTYYFSTSGGQTENSEFGFSGGSAVPYLKSVPDPFDDASPVHKWKQRYSDEEIESELAGLFSGKLKRVKAIERGKSPRIVRARVVGSSGSQVVTGATLRARLELRSTWARFKHR